MAKNFDSLSEDNPVMAILGKAKEELESNTETAAAPQTSESPVAVPVSAAATVPAEEPVEPKEINDEIPQAVNDIVMKTMKKEPMERDAMVTRKIITAVGNVSSI